MSKSELQYLLADAGATALIVPRRVRTASRRGARRPARAARSHPDRRRLGQRSALRRRGLRVRHRGQRRRGRRRSNRRRTTSMSSTPAAQPGCRKACCGANTTSSDVVRGARPRRRRVIEQHRADRGARGRQSRSEDHDPAATDARRRPVGRDAAITTGQSLVFASFVDPAWTPTTWWRRSSAKGGGGHRRWRRHRTAAARRRSRRGRRTCRSLVVVANGGAMLTPPSKTLDRRAPERDRDRRRGLLGDRRADASHLDAGRGVDRHVQRRTRHLRGGRGPRLVLRRGTKASAGSPSVAMYRWDTRATRPRRRPPSPSSTA